MNMCQNIYVNSLLFKSEKMRKTGWSILIILILVSSIKIASAGTLEQYRKVGDELIRIEEESISVWPEPGISRIIYPQTIKKGEIGYVGIEVNNTGSYAPTAYVVVSYSEGIKLVNYSDSPQIVRPGDEIFDKDRNPIKAKYPILIWSTEFYPNEIKLFSFNFSAREVGEHWFKVRLLFIGEGGVWGGRRIYPTEETKTLDQQKLPAIQRKISVIRLKGPTITLSCLCKENRGNEADIMLIFRNEGEKTLQYPVYYWNGRILKSGWNLAPGATKTFEVVLTNYSYGDVITATAGISGCFEPCSSGYYSKDFTVEIHVSGDEIKTLVLQEEVVLEAESPKEQIPVMEKIKIPKEVVTVESWYVKEDKSIIDSILEAISEFFRNIFLVEPRLHYYNLFEIEK